MNNEEEKKCPLCAEEMDWTDQQLNPCKCGYEVCVWCWNHLMDMAEKEATEGRCPACRTPYDKDRIVGLESNFERVAANSSSRKQKLPKTKAKPNEGRKDLSNVRVIQRKMAYIIGLPLDLADEELLQQKDYFGQYGKVTKVSLSRTAGGAIQQFINDTCSVYITYSKEEEAVACIQSVHGYVLDGRLLRASFGTAKYCHAWLRNTPCNNPACLYLHTIGADEDSFGKDEVAAVHTRNRVQEIVGGTRYIHRRSGSMLPPPEIEQINNENYSADDPVCNNDLKEIAYSPVASSDQKDGPARSSKQTASFSDIVGRSGSNKEVNSFEEERISDPWSDDNIVETEVSNPVQSVNSASESDLYSEPFREDSKVLTDSVLDDSVLKDSVLNDSVLNEGINENKFQSSAKSDKIYRGSNSFSNEEIVEHLRRLDRGSVVHNDETSAAVESSIISNILSMDLDGSDNSVIPQRVAGLFEGRDGRQGCIRNFQNNDQSRFSFANELGFSGQQNDVGSPSTNIASRAQNMTPPGFSVPSKPPPGFAACMRTEQAVAASSGNYMRVAPNDHYRSPSLGNLSNSSDDYTDPSIIVGIGKSPTTALTNSWTSSFSSRCSRSYDDDTKHWHFNQQQSQAPTATHHHQQPQYSLPTMQQFPSTQNDLYGGLTSRLADLHHQSFNNNPSIFTQHQQYSQPKFGGGYQQLNPLQQEAQPHDPRLDSFLPGYGDYMFQMPTSGDVYTPRVFGM